MYPLAAGKLEPQRVPVGDLPGFVVEPEQTGRDDVRAAGLIRSQEPLNLLEISWAQPIVGIGERHPRAGGLGQAPVASARQASVVLADQPRLRPVGRDPLVDGRRAVVGRAVVDEEELNRREICALRVEGVEEIRQVVRDVEHRHHNRNRRVSQTSPLCADSSPTRSAYRVCKDGSRPSRRTTLRPAGLAWLRRGERAIKAG
jgi:hypothetical protein